MLKTHLFYPVGHTAAAQEYGFSLITVSVLLTVAALVFVSVLPGQESGDVSQKILNNGKKLERVEEAMRSFMATNGRRPCPADGKYAENTVNFGVEAANPGLCTGGTPAVPLGPDVGTGYVIGGIIPTKTLGLPDEYAYDDYGRRFTYIVDVRATESPAAAITNNKAIITGGSNNTHAPGCYNLQQNIKLNGTTPGITIEATNGGTVIDHTMYAYISHGASGYGAWPAQGAADPAHRINSGSTDVDMQVNAGVDAVGASSTFTYSTTNFTNIKVQKDRVISNLPSGGTDTGFDDLVWYRQDTKNTCCLGIACLQTGFTAQGAGIAVAAGDINGDGIPDLIINSPSAVYVVFGTRLGFPDPLPLASLNGTNGFALTVSGLISTGAAAVGVTELATGDINGDGYADIIIGASQGGASAAGYTYVVFGHRGTWPATQAINVGYGTIIDGTHGVRFDGMGNTNQYGWSVAAGDVNGDGYADVIIGTAGKNAAYVVFGNNYTTSGSNFLSGLANTNITTSAGSPSASVVSYTGLMACQSLTASTIPAGITIQSCGGSSTCGTACTSPTLTLSTGTGVISGTVPLTLASTPLTIGANTLINGTTGVQFTGPSGQEIGQAVTTGDFNGDGIADIGIGDPMMIASTPYVYIVFGKTATWGASGTASLDLSTDASPGIIDGIQGVRFDGVYFDGSSIYTDAGHSLAMGDINGDGIADILMGAPIIGANSPDGYAYVVFGHPGTWPGDGVDNISNPGIPNGTYNLGRNGSLINGTQGVRFDSPTLAHDYHFGGAVAVGDINGDGYADIIIGDINLPSVFLVFGRKGSWSAPSIVLNTGGGNLINGITGVLFNGMAIFSLATGDINGDGIADLIMGNTFGTGAIYFGHKNNPLQPWPNPSYNLFGL